MASLWQPSTSSSGNSVFWRNATATASSAQPGEETAQGAQTMIDDGLLKRFPTSML